MSTGGNIIAEPLVKSVNRFKMFFFKLDIIKTIFNFQEIGHGLSQ